MLEKLLEFERSLFFLINGSHSLFWDRVMWLYSGLYVWLPFIAFFCFMLMYKTEKKNWLPVLFSILIVAILSMIFSSFITKPLFVRPRPVFHPSFMEEVRTLYKVITEPYGFVSGHSTTTFGIAMFTALLFRSRIYSIVIFLWAFVMGYSRIYLGMHFISDIIAGALAGVGIGYLIYLSYLNYKKNHLKNEDMSKINVYSPVRGKIIGIVLIIYIFTFTLMGGLSTSV